MVGKLMVVRLVLAISVLGNLLLTTSAQSQACSSHTFTENRVFTTCRDLPHLSSYLHWSYDQSSGRLDIAFRHSGISDSDRWVSWAINPNNDLSSSMTGAQALVAISQSGGTPRAYTSSIQSPATQLAEGAISYPHSGLTATRQNNEITIYATLTLPNNTATLVHLWNDGSLSGSTPQAHSLSNTQSKESLDLLSGATQAGSSGGSLRRRRNVSTYFSGAWTFFSFFF